jgi:hypothetical protein
MDIFIKIQKTTKIKIIKFKIEKGEINNEKLYLKTKRIEQFKLRKMFGNTPSTNT